MFFFCYIIERPLLCNIKIFFVIFVSVMDYWWKEMETGKSRTYCRLAFRQTHVWRILSLSLKWGWTFSCSWIRGKGN